MEILKFYATFCPQCTQVDLELQRKGIQYRSINCEKDDDPEVKALMKEYNISHHVPVVIIKNEDGSIKRLNNLQEVKQWLNHQ